MNALEERLRRELRAESEEITPDSLPGLRLPARSSLRRSRRRPGRARRWPAWAKPLAAAGALTVVVAGTFVIAHSIPAASPAKKPAPPPAAYNGVPDNYAYLGSGSIYNYVVHYPTHNTSYGFSGMTYVQVRATASGRVLATFSPPAPYNDFQLITGDARGDEFVLAAMRYCCWRTDAAPPGNFKRSFATPMKFVLLRITPGGRARLSALSLPVTVTPAQSPSIALSPDGSKLALAYGGATQPAMVQVVTLGTGQLRQWSAHTGWTPNLAPYGAWTADGRTLLVEQAPSQNAPLRTRLPTPANTVRLIDTGGAGGSLYSARLLVLRAPAGYAGERHALITPDGARLIETVATPWIRLRRGRPPVPLGHVHGEIAVYSARTGALLRTQAPWTWHVRGPNDPSGPSPLVAWSNRTGSELIVVRPVGHHPVLGVLRGNTFATTNGSLQSGHGYTELWSRLVRGYFGSSVTW